MNKVEYTIGVDEAGRGPLAGPVSVGLVLIKNNFAWEKELFGVRDSKKLSSQKREDIYKKAELLKKKGLLDFEVVFTAAKTIDKIGIVPAITKALHQGLEALLERSGLTEVEVTVKLDGGLKAPATYISQETIIKGDDKELAIGLASILAKVKRDQYMGRLSKKADFAVYEFIGHKGYGTKKHRTAIAKNGLSKEHRVSFCKNIRFSQKS